MKGARRCCKKAIGPSDNIKPACTEISIYGMIRLFINISLKLKLQPNVLYYTISCHQYCKYSQYTLYFLIMS